MLLRVGLIGGGGPGRRAWPTSPTSWRESHGAPALMAKVSVVADETLHARSSPTSSRPCCGYAPADGRELQAEVMTNRGGPERPLSLAELATKFQRQRAGLLPAAGRRRPAGRIARLDHLGRHGPLLDRLPRWTRPKFNHR